MPHRADRFRDHPNAGPGSHDRARYPCRFRIDVNEAKQHAQNGSPEVRGLLAAARALGQRDPFELVITPLTLDRVLDGHRFEQDATRRADQ
jgi:hypothetical protein